MSKIADYVEHIIRGYCIQSPSYSYCKEVEFHDLRRKQHLRYDFGIYNAGQLVYLIEVNGEQHYHYSSYFHKSHQAFTKQKEYDRIKMSYALAHNIPLYCLPYTDIYALTKLSDILNQKYLVKSKWHNDKLHL